MLFAFDTSKGETPESVKRKRELARALLSTGIGAPKDVGEGLSMLGAAIGSRLADSRANRAESDMKAGAASAMAPLLKLFSGGGQPAPANPVADAFVGPKTVLPKGGMLPSEAAQTAQANAAQVRPSFNGNLKDGIAVTAQSLGIKPEDLATAISYETAGTFDPMRAGPRTQWGQHKGLIQFGEPQAKKYGVNWSDPINSQLGENGAVAKYLRDAGVKPGMGLLDIYSAINAGGVGRYNASDANNGGAPGTVADKVNKQMAGHRAKAMAMFGENAGQPVQVASNDQGFVPANANPNDVSRETIPPSQQPQQQPQQVAQNAPQQGNDPFAQISTEQLLQLVNDPAVMSQPGYAAIVQQLVQQRLTPPDPMAAMKSQEQQLQIEKLKQEVANGSVKQVGNKFVNIQTGQTVYDAGPDQMSEYQAAQTALEREKFAAEKNKPMVVGGESRLAAPDGKVLLDAVSKVPTQPAAIQEYEYAKSQGFPGSFQDWEASKKGGMSLQTNPDGTVTFQQGNNIKPLTEAQSKDTVYATRAEGALKEFEPLSGAMAGLQGNTIGQFPLIGNALQPEEFQKATQAGNNFLTALLRKESGATITPDEEALYGRIFLPRMGDAAGTLEQKKRARVLALEAIKAGMTPQAILSQAQALVKVNQQAPAQQNMPAPPNQGGLPPDAVRELMADPSPESQSMFDEIFGQGAAQRALGGR